MQRRQFLAGGATLALAGLAGKASAAVRATGEGKTAAVGGGKLTPPSSGSIPVAVAISEGVTVIDFAGPWEVFQDVTTGGNEQPFRLYTVSETTRPVTGSAGLKIVPDYSFEQAPQPGVIVVPAQKGSKALHAWLRQASEKADLTMSVCTGAFQLARAGLLAGKAATTHHEFTDALASQFPDVEVRRGLRFVENGKICTAGGLTSGIDLALRIVERYYGRAVAEKTAFYMEYQSKGWIV
jgi:transcriptional regulator GlxA family with amidase domain